MKTKQYNNLRRKQLASANRDRCNNTGDPQGPRSDKRTFGFECLCDKGYHIRINTVRRPDDARKAAEFRRHNVGVPWMMKGA